MRRQVEKLLSQKNPLRFLAARIMHRLGAAPRRVIARPRFKLWMRPCATALGYWSERDFHSEDHAFLERTLRPGDTVVDVGANIGSLALDAAALVGPSGTVYAYEAHPRIFEYLNENRALNSAENLVCRNVAVGDAPGNITFSDIRSDEMNRVADTGISVSCVTLDEDLNHLPRIDLLKIDVEGYEHHVLTGARETLKRTSRIYFEVSDRKPYGYGYDDLKGLLEGSGFTLTRADGSSLDGYRPPKNDNLLAVRSKSANVELV